MNNMKQGWEIKKLSDVCRVISGQSPEGKYYNSEGNGIPFYQGKKEFTEKYIGEPTTKICIGSGLTAIGNLKIF